MDNLNQAQNLIDHCIATLSPKLDLGYCGITDLNKIPQLFQCTHLTTLILSNKWWEFEDGSFQLRISENKGKANSITDIPKALQKLKKLQHLIIANDSPVKLLNVKNLQNLKDLRILDLSHNQISDLTFLKGFKFLSHLYLNDNIVTSITPLRRLYSLNVLGLKENNLGNITHLADLTKLLVLDLSENKIHEIDTLSNLLELRILNLGHNQISNLAPLEKLKNLQDLGLASNSITSIDPLSSLTELKFLNVRSNLITDVSPLSQLIKLEYLDISLNKFYKTIHEKIVAINSKEEEDEDTQELLDIGTFEKLNSLKTLKVSQNGIKATRYLRLPANLEVLDLSHNLILNIQFIADYPHLEVLDINSNQLTDITPLRTNTKLKQLNLRNNKILDIHPLQQHLSLKTLLLSENAISDITAISSMDQLEILDLSGNQISNIDPLTKLINLKTLRIKKNRVTDISALKNLTKLQTIEMNKNEIVSIAPLENLVSLEVLHSNNNEISDLQPLKNLSKLKTLQLNTNRIKSITGLETLIGLKKVLLNANQLTNIDALASATGLNVLSAVNNQISDVSFLSNMTELIRLALTRNLISNVDFLKNNQRLQNLSLANNKIENIAVLKHIKPPKILNFQRNHITTIPLEVYHNIPHITLEKNDRKGLLVAGNPITAPPPEIVKQGRESALEWYAARKRKLNEIKIILIGEPKAGKTSLLRRLKGEEFDEHEPQTDGINIDDIIFENCDTFAKQVSLHGITGHFWDFGGQEIMNATHQFFLTNRSVYVLVLDARRDNDVSGQIRQWVRRIKSTAGNSPVIVVANQADVNQGFGFSNETDLQQEFPELRGFIKASCKTNSGVDDIIALLAEQVPQAEMFNTEIDERWITIKSQLQEETQSKNFLSESRFTEICANNGIVKNNERLNAINFFHDLGLVLHFDALNLAEYYVLDPYWITYGVYQILTSQYAAQQDGRISMEKLEYIVNEEKDKEAVYRPKEYRKIIYNSTNQRRFLVDILHQFKLCFYLNENKEFLIPDLLGTSEPTNLTEMLRNSAENIRFSYQYNYLPKTILPYLMVETHNMAKALWRTGCVLSNDGCQAMVSTYQNNLSIIVSGEHKKKREFMAVIRNRINTINDKLNIEPNMLIPLPGINPSAYADYKVLLVKEKRGKTDFIFDEDKPSEVIFPISILLEGIAPPDEMKMIGESMHHIERKLTKIESSQLQTHSLLDYYYETLITKIEDQKFSAEIIEAIAELNELQKEEIAALTLGQIGMAFELFSEDTDDKLKDLYADLKKSDNVELKLKLGLPLLKILGIDLETKYDIKPWAKKSYQKTQFKVLQLLYK